MNILSLHFGHDAAVCVMRDGEVAAYVLRERHARIKHAISLEFKLIQMAMDAAHLSWEQIDYCAVTSTQKIELIIDDPTAFSLRIERDHHPQIPSTMVDLVKQHRVDPEGLFGHSLMNLFYDPRNAGSYLQRLGAVGNAIQWQSCNDAALSAAEDLAADRVIGWFEGRSEIGPRALGHRSILADARRSANWARVNALKGREAWRPFAPAVLESEAEKWFLGLPASSPYMLFTGIVRSHDLPAITHVDGSARVQTVDPSCGEFFRVIQFFHALTGVPVILNTSFNGPGEPIVEAPEDALNFLTQSDLDVLYIGGIRVTRIPPCPEGQQ